MTGWRRGYAMRIAFRIAAAQNPADPRQTSSKEVDDEQDAPSRGGYRRFSRCAASGSRRRCGRAKRPGPVRQGEFPDFVQLGRAAAVRARGGDVALVFLSRAHKAFQAVIKADPQCAMAYWGLAISQRGNPLVPPWPEESLKRALEAIQQGKAVAKTERERDWLNALEVVYKDYDKVAVSERSKRYERAMEELARKYPDDKEASIFYALALLEAVDHADKTYARQLKAGGILEPIDREQPAHPGLAHYIIHTYDFEPLAVRGVDAADKYAKVAPAAPHAQHMPSHIYSILGRWEDSIRSNQAAVK